MFLVDNINISFETLRHFFQHHTSLVCFNHLIRVPSLRELRPDPYLYLSGIYSLLRSIGARFPQDIHIRSVGLYYRLNFEQCCPLSNNLQRGNWTENYLRL